MTPKPLRLQLSRAKGFNLQALSQATNGLPTVNVARPSKWGNPYRAACDDDGRRAVERFRRLFDRRPSRMRHMMLSITKGNNGHGEGAVLRMKTSLPELRGKNLACWCKPGAFCHGDVLLDLANTPVCEAVP